MRILLYEPSRFGGLKVYTEGLAGGLARLGKRVSVLTRPAQLPDPQGYEVIAKLRDPSRKVGRAFWALDRMTTAIFNNIKLLREASLGYDVCHLQHVQPLFSSFTVRAIPIPVVLTVHDVFPHTRRWWEKGGFYKSLFRAIDHIIVHSHHNAEVLIKVADLDPARVSVVPHGLEPVPSDAIVPQNEARRRLKLPLGVPIALAFGGVRPDKGLDVVLQALGLVDDWVLVVAGESYDLAPYEELAQRLGVEPRVFWRVGYVPDDLVPLYFAAADVVVLPYKPSFESQSGVLFQAYRYHRPVVVTDVGGLGEAVREDGSGIVVPPDDPPAFAGGMNTVRQLGAHIVWASLEHKYAWDMIARATFAVYRQVLEGFRERGGWKCGERGGGKLPRSGDTLES